MGYVYLLCAWPTEKYKIGFTKNNIGKRIKQLQTGNPDEIIEVNHFESEVYARVENWIKRKHESVKINEGGTEWFLLDDAAIATFKDDCIEAEKIIKLLLKENPFYK